MKQSTQNSTAPRLRQTRPTRPRPKTIHVDDGSVDLSEASSISSRSKKGSSTNLTGKQTTNIYIYIDSDLKITEFLFLAS